MYKKESLTKFYIIAGSLTDLSKFDFNCYNIQCLRIDSDKLKDICNDMTDDESYNNAQEIFEEISGKFRNEEKPFVLLPIDFSKPFYEKSLIECYKIILIIYPSDLTIYGEISFQLFDNKFLHFNIYSEYGFYSTGRENYYDNFVHYDVDALEEINHFIKLYHERKDGLAYLETTTNSYISSFRERRPDMAFLNLCISLESIIEGKEELSYRIKRNVSILCAKNKSQAESIFNNLNLIYSLRSKIIHASKYKYDKTDEYLPYIQSLISRLIIELILQNIKDLTDLNKKLTFAGFGDRANLNDEGDYTSMSLNISSYYDTFITKLKK